MKILHISAECYPMAKVGGLADVVGALPKYQISMGIPCAVLVPMHRTVFLKQHHWDVVYKGKISLANVDFEFTVIKERNNSEGYELYCLDIFGLLDRERVYGYDDDNFRFLAFQIAALHWINSFKHLPELLHVHDHHTGLMPFMIKFCFDFLRLQQIKTLFTIHNAAYQGIMDMEFRNLLPAFDEWKTGMLFWNNKINSLACAVKCADSVTTVSPGYLSELFHYSFGLEQLFHQEHQKCKGILNGIDDKVWNPITDDMIEVKYDQEIVDWGKYANKMHVCNAFGFDPELPLIVFIGRLVWEKAADLLFSALREAFRLFPEKFSCIVLGNGDSSIEQDLMIINKDYHGFYRSQIKYDEVFSHQLYASADFLLMPSRTEPCGLNQLYAMRYGTIPIVRSIGGLKDTVVDISAKNGFGICFEHLSIQEITHGIKRAIEIYENKKQVTQIRKHMMNINHSWQKSASEYVDIYHSLISSS
jgi:starch synthase